MRRERRDSVVLSVCMDSVQLSVIGVQSNVTFSRVHLQVVAPEVKLLSTTAGLLSLKQSPMLVNPGRFGSVNYGWFVFV